MKIRSRSIGQSPGFSETDTNDRFMRSLCALWASRILRQHPRLDRQTIEFVIWVLDPMTEVPLQTLTAAISPNEDVDIAGIFHENEPVPDELAFALNGPLSHLQPRLRNRVIREMINALEKIVMEMADVKPAPLARSVAKVATTYGLSDDELTVSFFLANVSAWPTAEKYFESHLECGRPPGRKYLLSALKMSQSRIQKVLQGKLSQLGILDTRYSSLDIDSDFSPLFTDSLEVNALKKLYRRVPNPDIGIDSLGVDQAELNLLERLLGKDTAKSTHILLYGPPGTGKTTLARCLVSNLELDGIEVMGREDGTPRNRRSALEACLHMSENSPRRVVVIDEADHLLNTESSWLTSGDAAEKAWLNEVLERPGLRCLWIVNDTSEIEPSVQRRFDYSLEVPAPDQHTRRLMLEKILRRKRIKRHFSDDQMGAIVRDYPVNPAVIAAAAETAKLAKNSAIECRKIFEKSLEARLKLAGKPRKTQLTVRTPFIPEGINTDVPLETMEEQIRSYNTRWQDADRDEFLPSLNLLFHGAPGTGKSFSAQHLAEVVDRPVLVKRASDLLGPYVGMTEQLIAGAFTEARQSGAVLVVDEIDSFLYARSANHRTWEISTVTEFLVQLEAERGIFIGTTNRVEAIDSAARRRFLGQVEFKYLRSEQMVAVYRKVLGDQVTGQLSQKNIIRLEGMKKGTTAGIFAARNRLALREKRTVSHEEVLSGLEKDFKGGGGQNISIGF